jgi:chromosomal replication initiator protein|tara:strand:- start:3929 stop:5275 length:1347 start_codon:yes stop_codon:yes gene_type:complete
MKHISLWEEILEKINGKLPAHAINTWFNPIVPVGLTGSELLLEVPNQFFYEWIDSHYKKEFLELMPRVNGESLGYRFIVSTDQAKRKIENFGESPRKQKNLDELAPTINKRYVFDSFIEGSNNEFAKSAAESVAENPGNSSFNPLIIYGGVGLGKTHLLHAIGNSISTEQPRSRVVVVTSEKFTLDFVNSLRKNRTVEFAKQYRNADVLLIDDIQFFRGKEQTQEQFFHTFNTLYQSGKQIVMTADKYPGEMQGLQDRLLSRFQSGLSVDIQPPNFEVRVAILLEKAEQNGIDLDYDITQFIARHIKNNVRDLEGTIIRILAKSSLMNREIDFDLVKDVVKERAGKGFTSDITIEDIVKKVSEVSKVSEKEIVGKSRKMEIAQARQLSMYLCRDIIGTSLSNIGVYFGGRDHTTVMHAVKTINKKTELDEQLKTMISGLRQEFDFSLN